MLLLYHLIPILPAVLVQSVHPLQPVHTVPVVAIVKEERAKHVVNQTEGAEAEAEVAVVRFEGKKHITGVIAVNKYNYLTKY